jgi:hypothetical protein
MVVVPGLGAGIHHAKGPPFPIAEFTIKGYYATSYNFNNYLFVVSAL